MIETAEVIETKPASDAQVLEPEHAIFPSSVETRLRAAKLVESHNPTLQVELREVLFSDGGPPSWPFGQNSDVFIFNGKVFYQWRHREDERVFSLEVGGNTGVFARNQIANAVGFDITEVTELKKFSQPSDPGLETMDYYQPIGFRPPGPFYAK